MAPGGSTWPAQNAGEPAVSNRYATPRRQITFVVTEATRLRHIARYFNMKQLIAAFLLLAMAVPLSGCVVAGPGRGGGWCYYHPYRCR